MSSRYGHWLYITDTLLTAITVSITDVGWGLYHGYEYVVWVDSMNYVKTQGYVFVVGLGWCPLSRHARYLTVSLKQMAKIMEIKKVPTKISPYLTIKNFHNLWNFSKLNSNRRLYRCNIVLWLTNSELKFALLFHATLLILAIRIVTQISLRWKIYCKIH